MISIKDEAKILSPSNNQIILQFSKNIDESDISEGQIRKLILGNCKLLDSKNEKNSAYEITMPKDDKFGYFSCDNLKGAVTAGQEITVNFKFKHPQLD